MATLRKQFSWNNFNEIAEIKKKSKKNFEKNKGNPWHKLKKNILVETQ